MIKKIIQTIKPKYFFDYILILALFWNFSFYILSPLLDFLGDKNIITRVITFPVTFYLNVLIPKGGELEGLAYLMVMPFIMAILINLLALIIKRATGKLKYSSVIGATLIFVLLSILVMSVENAISSTKYNNLRQERELIGKEIIISLEGCDLYQEPDNEKQIKCRFTLSNVPPIATEKPIIEIIMRSDLNPINRVSLDEPVKLARTGNDTFEGDFIITKLSGEEFSSIYISLFELIDGFKRYPSEDLKLYLIR